MINVDKTFQSIRSHVTKTREGKKNNALIVSYNAYFTQLPSSTAD